MDYSYVKLVHPSSTKIMDTINANISTFMTGKISAKEVVARSKPLVQQLLKAK